MANSVSVFAPAKINLFLHVGDKRSDGYHALQSLVVFADVGDELILYPADVLSLSVEGPFAADLGLSDDNLVIRAARALNATARIVLTKNLPVASGIGGGSADAAAALRGLNELYDVGRNDLARVAASLGSDVPVCVASEAAWMEGRGEILTPATVPGLPLVLVNPRVGVSTADVFRALHTRSGVAMRVRETTDLLDFLKHTSNDLQEPALSLQPVIGAVLNALGSQQDVLLCRMSGSGATCFGIFQSEHGASRAAGRLAAEHPDWWVCATKSPR